jgi:hypothetical protein
MEMNVCPLMLPNVVNGADIGMPEQRAVLPD